jgi:hypothetical protein
MRGWIPSATAGRLDRRDGCGYYRLRPAPTGYRGRDERGIAGSRRSLAPRRTIKLAELQVFTGATGLEPATSGVTGLSHGYDDWRRLTRYRSIHAVLRGGRCFCARSRRLAFGRLLPFCCPDAVGTESPAIASSIIASPVFASRSGAILVGGTSPRTQPVRVVVGASGESTLGPGDGPSTSIAPRRSVDM